MKRDGVTGVLRKLLDKGAHNLKLKVDELDRSCNTHGENQKVKDH
jgi:hypothetical protein